MSGLVSVIIPTYNRASLVCEAIKSVIDQTYDNWELIVVDDRSTDNTREIVEKFVARDKRIKYVLNQHKKGPSGARNQGLDLASGDYIAFLDSDDLWKPWHLEEGIYYITKYPKVDWFYADSEIVRENKVIVSSVLLEKWAGRSCFDSVSLEEKFFLLKDRNFIINFLRYGLYAGLQTSIIKRRIFENVRFNEDLIVGEDRFLVLQSFFLGFKFAYLLKCHVSYRLHDQQLSNASLSLSFEKQVGNIFELLRFYFLAYKTFKYSLREKLEFRRVISDIYFWQIAYLFWSNNYKLKSFYYFLKAVYYYPVVLFRGFKYFFKKIGFL